MTQKNILLAEYLFSSTAALKMVVRVRGCTKICEAARDPPLSEKEQVSVEIINKCTEYAI